MASWAHMLLLFGGVMAVVYILPALFKLIFRIVSSLLFLVILWLAVTIYLGGDVVTLLDESLTVVASMVRDVVGRFS